MELTKDKKTIVKQVHDTTMFPSLITEKGYENTNYLRENDKECWDRCGVKQNCPKLELQEVGVAFLDSEAVRQWNKRSSGCAREGYDKAETETEQEDEVE
uniref:Uncharacterized protein n=1 Tax=Setaria digitata TaxID=48799 RepID=A0A915PMW7_9BILA